MTHEDVKLWLQLKQLNRAGHHFRRQAPVDNYILDFVEFGRKLIIEVDGSQHSHAPNQIRDAARDDHFRKSGFRILRFWNLDINQAMGGVMDRIFSALNEPPPAAAPPPPP